MNFLSPKKGGTYLRGEGGGGLNRGFTVLVTTVLFFLFLCILLEKRIFHLSETCNCFSLLFIETRVTFWQINFRHIKKFSRLGGYRIMGVIKKVTSTS